MNSSLAHILGPDGTLSHFIAGYEHREQQTEMLCDVEAALSNESIALIEAGTGIGKSMAYLLPALYWAVQKKEKILISTHTIALQEQLFHKDVPLAKKVLGISLKAVLVKGMSNYLCLRKLEEAKIEKNLLSEREFEEQENIEAWAEKTADGTRTSLLFEPSPSSWERVAAESDTCSFHKCPFYSRCHFFKARKQAEEAQILIANHSLLFADLAFRQKEKEGGLLPDYKKVILDEAHHIEDVATDFFAKKVSYLSLLRLLGKLGVEKQGKLAQLKERLFLHFSKETPDNVRLLLSRLNIDLPILRRDLLQKVADLFRLLAQLVQKDPLEGESRFRLLPEHRERPFWKQEIIPETDRLIQNGKQFIQSIHQLMKELADLKEEKWKEKAETLQIEIQALVHRLEERLAHLEHFMKGEFSQNKVRWMEKQPLKHLINIHLIEADLDLSTQLAKDLFNAFSTTVLASATLSSADSFRFFRERVGLTPTLLKDKTVVEKRYVSPFDYANQAKLIIVNDMPLPQETSFTRAAIENIWKAIQGSRGNAFVLFTSYAMMKECALALKERLQTHRFPLLIQGDANRLSLLDQFRKTNYSVLFGTDSFWEGVDVVGEALRCVILVKLPFRVPSEPIIQARHEAIQERGGDPFSEHSLPAAVVKFKQGFGRLIRHKKDRGCIVCLDSRLVSKSYGMLFLKSLPACQQAIIPGEKLREEMETFYRKTYYLVKDTAL